MTSPAAEAPRRHVAVFAFPDYGHVKPLLGVTRRLVERGHRVSWITDLRYQDAIGQAGGSLIGYRSARPAFGAGPVVTAAEMGRLGVAYLTESIETILPLADRALAEDAPDLVLYDQENVLPARALADRWQSLGLQVFPCFASGAAYSLHDEVFDYEADTTVHEAVGLVQAFLAAQGRDPDEVWTALTPWDERNLVLLPRALQPRGADFDGGYTFVGHCVEAADIAEASWSPPAGAESVVLISLGTEAANPEFFATCFEAFADRSRHAVLTLGPRHAEVAEAQVHANVELHAWLPHTAVLPHADAFVTHGGMGSIVEALYYGVPMVVVPHSPEPGINARRIAELGLGVVLEAGELTAANLAAAVTRVAEDPEMRRRVARMRESAIAEGGVPQAVRLIESLLEDTTRKRDPHRAAKV